ncbi:MAG: stage II sporulation protein M [Myxococcota bacterium]
MRTVEFRRRREADWARLESMVDRVLKRGLNRLSDAELEELPRLYRGVLSSLSVARKTTLDRALVQYLEALAARSYLAVYAARRSRTGDLWRALFEEVPRRLRTMKVDLAMSIAITGVGVIVAWTLVSADPGWYFMFVAPGLAGDRDPSASTEVLRTALYEGGGEAGLVNFASSLFAHNTGIALLAAALGFAAGIPTALLLFTNGLMLGAFLQLYASRGLLFPLLGWLLPHGIPEIGAIVLCGAVGLHWGRAVVAPGRFTTAVALGQAGRRGSLIVLSCVGLLALAGVIEGIFRQVVLDDRVRWALAAFNGAWFFLWLSLGGRRAPSARRDKVRP